MKKSTVVILVVLVVSIAVITWSLLSPTINPLFGWDYAFLLASLAFCFSLIYLADLYGHNWLELWSAIGPVVASFFFVVSLFVLVGSIIMFFLPEGWKLFSGKTWNIVMISSVVALYLSVSYFSPS